MQSGNFKFLCDSSNTQTDNLVQYVIHRIKQRKDLAINDMAATSSRLATLWRANIAELTHFTRISSSNIGIDKHYKLLEPVLKDQTVFGCTGDPVWYMPRPQYACETLSTLITKKRPTTKVNLLDPANKQRHNRKKPRISAVEGDLLIGVKVYANLPALLRLQHMPLPEAYISDESLNKWVEGRVVSITAISTRKSETGGSYKHQQIRVRCGRNGAEIESHWPGNINITTQLPLQDLQATVDLTANSQMASGIGLSVSSRGVGSAASALSPAAAASSSRTNNSAPDLLTFTTPDIPRRDRLLPEGAGDDRMGAAEQSAEEALRILLGGAPLGSHRSGFSSDSSSDDEDGGEIGGLWQSLFGASSSSVDDRVAQSSTATSGAVMGTGPVGMPSVGGASKERLLLATGQCLRREQLEEIEESLGRQQLTRPRFVLNPQRGQHIVSEEVEEARRRKSRARSSRNWAGEEPLPDRDTSEQEEQSALALEGLVLSALEDPTVPLPEPGVVVIGRALKKLRRREDFWTTELMDVYMRVLPDGQNAIDSSINSYRDMVVPRCVLRLQADGSFPVSPLSPAPPSSDVEGGVGGGRDHRGDGQWAENLALLHALLV